MSNRYTLLQDQDGQWISAPNNGGDIGDMFDVVVELNKLMSERNEAREQRDRLQAKLAEALEKLENTRKQRDSCHNGWGNDIQKYLAEIRRAEVMLNEAVEQRDSLAEALRELMAEYDDRKNQFGDSPLWDKHEDVDVIDKCHAMLALDGGGK